MQVPGHGYVLCESGYQGTRLLSSRAGVARADRGKG